MARGELLPNKFEEKMNFGDPSEAFLLFCEEKSLDFQMKSSVDAWIQLGTKGRAEYRAKAGFQVMKINQRSGTLAQTSSDATRNKRIKKLTKKTTKPLRKRPLPKKSNEDDDDDDIEVILELPTESELNLDSCPYWDCTRSNKYFAESGVKIDGTTSHNFFEETHYTSAEPASSRETDCSTDCEVHRTQHRPRTRPMSPNEFWWNSQMTTSGNVFSRKICPRLNRRKYSKIRGGASLCFCCVAASLPPPQPKPPKWKQQKPNPQKRKQQQQPSGTGQRKTRTTIGTPESSEAEEEEADLFQSSETEEETDDDEEEEEEEEETEDDEEETGTDTEEEEEMDTSVQIFWLENFLVVFFLRI